MTLSINLLGHEQGTITDRTPFAGLVLERYLVEDTRGVSATTEGELKGKPVVNTGGTFPGMFTNHPELPGYVVRQITFRPIDECTGTAQVRYTINTRNRRVVRTTRTIPSLDTAFAVPYFTRLRVGSDTTWSEVKYQSIKRAGMKIVITRFVVGQSLDNIQTILAQNLGRLFPVGPDDTLAMLMEAPSDFDQNRNEATIQHVFRWSQPFLGVPSGSYGGLDVELPFLPSLHEYNPIQPVLVGSAWTAPSVGIIAPELYSDIAPPNAIPWL